MANFKPLSVAAVIINKRHYAAHGERSAHISPSRSLAFKGAKVRAARALRSSVRQAKRDNTWDQRRSIARGSFTNEHGPITSVRVM